MNRHEILRRVASVFFPERCLLCGEVVAFDDFICENCKTEPADCSDCGHLHNCGVAGADAAAAYTGGVIRLIRTLKEKPDSRIAGFFAERMAELAREHEWRPQLVVPVPSSPKKLGERGFNQAGLLAGGLADRLGLPFCADLLGRRDKTLTQHELTERERLENAYRSYYLMREGEAHGKAVLLVDDVLTTGATAAACADCLLRDGAAAVYVIAAAHTQLRDVFNP